MTPNFYHHILNVLIGFFFKTCGKGFLTMFYQEVWSKFKFEYIKSILIQYHPCEVCNHVREYRLPSRIMYLYGWYQSTMSNYQKVVRTTFIASVQSIEY